MSRSLRVAVSPFHRVDLCPTDEAARYMACMAELLMRADQPPIQFRQLRFVVIAPEEQIRAGVFIPQATPAHIHETVKRRVADYQGERDHWFSQWFEPVLGATIIECLSWEAAVDRIRAENKESGHATQVFYRKCLDYGA